MWAHKNKKPNGFTVVELLIVMVVMAILVTLVVVVYNGIQRNSAKTIVIDTLKKTSDALRVERTFDKNAAWRYPRM